MTEPVVKRVIRKTLSQIGGMGWILSTVVVPAALAAIQIRLGKTMSELYGEFWTVLGPTLIIWAVLFGTLFVINLVRMPLIIEREQHALTKARLDQTEKILAGRPVERHLSSQAAGKIAKAMGELRSGTGIENCYVIFWNTSEAADFATEISDAIRLSGVKSSAHQGGMYPHDVKDRGVFIEYEPEALQNLASQLAQIFLQEGITASIRRKEDDGSQSFNVYVARPA